jgi:hypothetical protein
VKPLVFLDFDGVIMTLDSYRAAQPKLDSGASDWLRQAAYHRMDPALVANVSTLCERVGADIVLSTSWRTSDEEGRASLESTLWDRGLSRRVQVLGQTPFLSQRHGKLIVPTGCRGDEIEAWLNAHRPGWTRDRLVILDDDSDMEPLVDRWVQCSWDGGFGAAQLAEAFALFGGAR